MMATMIKYQSFFYEVDEWWCCCLTWSCVFTVPSPWQRAQGAAAVLCGPAGTCAEVGVPSAGGGVLPAGRLRPAGRPARPPHAPPHRGGHAKDLLPAQGLLPSLGQYSVVSDKHVYFVAQRGWQ